MLKNQKGVTIIQLIASIFMLTLMLVLFKVPGIFIFMGCWMLISLVAMLRSWWLIRKMKKEEDDLEHEILDQELTDLLNDLDLEMIKLEKL